MASRRRLFEFAATTVLALVAAHNLVFLLAYGPGYDEALAHSGHDGAWGAAVAVTLAMAFGLLGLGSWRLYRLGVLARATGPGDTEYRPLAGDFARQLANLWMRVAGATSVLFVVQENLEHQRVGEVLPGLAVLGSAEYPNAALVIAAVALAIAFVVVLFRCQRDALVARIRAARVRWAAASHTVRRRPTAWVDRRHASIIVHQFSGRAPPQLISA